MTIVDEINKKIKFIYLLKNDYNILINDEQIILLQFIQKIN